jgi:hypothetical protein
MTATVDNPPVQAPARRRSWAARAWGAAIGAWGAFTGVLPHVLHHVGPLAGTALVEGAGGRLLFGGVGLVASIPFLLRLRRRFQSWAAPAIVLVVFAAMFAFSTLVIGPRISGDTTTTSAPQPAPVDEHGHPTSTAP